jgi:hypothetical protein
MAPIIDLFPFLHFGQEKYWRCDNTPISAPVNISQHRDMKVKIMRTYL